MAGKPLNILTIQSKNETFSIKKQCDSHLASFYQNLIPRSPAGYYSVKPGHFIDVIHAVFEMSRFGAIITSW